MTNKDVKSMLRESAARARVPDVLRGVRNADSSGYAGTEFGGGALAAAGGGRNKRLTAISALSLAAAACILVFSFTVLPDLTTDKAVYATVSMDAAPSLELLLNKNDAVVDFNILNEAAESVTDIKKLKNKPVDKVMGGILTACAQKGYFDGTDVNYILLSVDSEDAGAVSRLEQKLKTAAAAHCAGNGINADAVFTAVDRTLRERAEACCTTPAKLRLILEAYGLSGRDLSEDEFILQACGWSVTDLYRYIEANGTAGREA